MTMSNFLQPSCVTGNRWVPVIVILMTAVLVRLMFIHCTVGFHYGEDNIRVLGGDETEYLAFAENIANGRDYGAGITEKMWRTPGYPLLVSTIFTFFGHSLVVIRLTHALLGGLVCVLILRIGSKLFGPSTGILSALYFAIYPPHVYYSREIVSENLLLLCSLLAVLFFFNAVTIPKLKNAVLCGTFLGIATLVRPEAGGIVVCLITFLVFFSPFQCKVRLFTSTVVVLSMILVLSPWLMRNYALSGRLILSSLSGEVFWGGNNEHTLNEPEWRGYWMYPHKMEGFDLVRAEKNEIRRDQIRWRLGLEFLNDHKADIPRLVYYKVKRFYSVMVQGKTETIVLILSFGLLLPFILIGFFVSLVKFLRTRSPGVVLHMIVVYYNLLAIVFWGSNRFRLSIDPFLIMFGISAVLSIAAWISKNEYLNLVRNEGSTQ